MMRTGDQEEILKAVRERYAKAARQGTGGCCASSVSTCCEAKHSMPEPSTDLRLSIHSEQQALEIPDGSDMGLGCGNPITIALITPGEVVLDLGSGGGVDCFLAAREAGGTGRVIGVDMTPEMVSKARGHARDNRFENVEFRLGEMEHLPVADESVDVVISNCVINLSPDKERVLSAVFRVLRPGGRLAVADMVARAPLPEAVKNDLDLYVACISGAVLVDDLERMLGKAGFYGISVRFEDDRRESVCDCARGTSVEGLVAPAAIRAFKPGLGDQGFEKNRMNGGKTR